MPGRDPDKPAGGPSLPAEARWNRVSAKAGQPGTALARL